MSLARVLAEGSEPERQTAISLLHSQEELSQQLHHTDTLEEFFAKAAGIRQLIGAEHVCLFRLDGHELVNLEADGGEKRLPLEQAGIPGYVARSGQLVNVPDAGDAAALEKIYPGLTPDPALPHQQLLAVPITFGGQTIGVILAGNRSGSKAFDFMDEECLRDMGSNLGPILQSLVRLNAQSRQLEHQEKLLAINDAIHSARDLDHILISLRHDILALFGAERLTIYALDPESGELFSRYKDGDEIKEIRLPVDERSIAGFAASSRRPVNVANVYDDQALERIHPSLAFNRRFDEESGFLTRAVLAMPIEFEGNLLGCAQLINRVDGCEFNEADEAGLRQIAATLGIAFSNQSRVTGRRSRYDKLVERGLISRRNLEAAQKLAAKHQRPVETVLLEEFNVPRNDLINALALWHNCPAFIFSDRMAVPGGVITSLEGRYEDMKARLWVPVSEEGKKIVVALANPKDIVARDLLENHILFGRQVEYRFALPEDIVAAVDHIFGRDGDKPHTQIGELLDELESDQDEEVEEGQVHEGDEDHSAIVKLINRIIEDAYARRATDIHIEPAPRNPVTVRYRVDGDLEKVMEVPGRLRRVLASRIKIMSDLDIAERRLPQSGKISFKRWGRLDIELRVETIPVAGDLEDCVLRILTPASNILKLEDLNMSERNLREFKQAVARPYGLVLCVGPTGSGKTTTLHAALGHLNQVNVKIWTAEDPVEITQAGLRQVQINRKAGLDFAACMRSFLRADPDIVMVGEMRDSETANMGIEASLTGHLVLSTLHTNNAPETVARLLKMNIDPYSFADALLAVLAQRLVRTLCDCRVTREIDEKEYDLLRDEFGDADGFTALAGAWQRGFTLPAPGEGGCDKCHGSGYTGRLGVHELMVLNEELKSLIYARAKAADIREAAERSGMRTLKQDGIAKVLGGHTTMDRVRKACSV